MANDIPKAVAGQTDMQRTDKTEPQSNDKQAAKTACVTRRAPIVAAHALVGANALRTVKAFARPRVPAPTTTVFLLI